MIKVSLLVNSGMPINAGAEAAQILSARIRLSVALPPAPRLRSVWTVQCVCWLILALLVCIGGAAGIYVAPQAMLLLRPSVAGDWPMTTGSIPGQVPQVLRGGLALAWVAGGAWLVRLVIRALRNEQTFRRAQYAVAMVQWLELEARWQALYYCAQDDGVFLAGSPRVVPTALVQEFLINEQGIS